MVRHLPSSRVRIPLPAPAVVEKVNQAWTVSDPDASVTRQSEGRVAASCASSIAAIAGLPSIVLTFQVNDTMSRQ